MKGSLYTIMYAALLGIFCASLLTAASSFTKPYYEANKEAEKILNILAALKVPFEAGASAIELSEVYEANVKEETKGDMIFYAYSPADRADETLAVVVEFAGPGLWGPVKGFLALEPDMKTIRGLTFYQQEETPGLGGEIVTEGFRSQFSGKQIVGEDGTPGIVIKGTGSTAVNQVDAITGATMTCDKVQEMLNITIEKIIAAN